MASPKKLVVDHGIRGEIMLRRTAEARHNQNAVCRAHEKEGYIWRGMAAFVDEIVRKR